MPTYTVQFEIEVTAATPTQAATVARDIMLDIDAKVGVDVFPMKYVEEADDWFPTRAYGWYAYFDGAVQPVDFFAWEVLP